MPKIAQFSNHITKQHGFTLIELMIVTSLMVILILTVSSMFMTFLISNAKTNTKNTLKVEGSYALGQMEFLLRNSYTLVDNATGQICQTGMDSIAFDAINGGTTELQLDVTGKIASNSAFLTSNAVAARQLVFDCYENADGSRYVDISFQLDKVAPTINQTAATPASTESFAATVVLRN